MLPIPFLPLPPNHRTRCHAGCIAYANKDIDPFLAPLSLHGFSCVCGARITRHNNALHHIARTTAEETHATTDFTVGAISSAANGLSTLTDCLFTWLDGSRAPLKIDPTIVCPFNATNRRYALRSFEALIEHHTNLKNNRHLPGCVGIQGIAFLPAVLTTLGAIGPPATIVWIDSLFDTAAAHERKAGGNGLHTARRRTLFYQTLHAIITRGNHHMLRAVEARLPSLHPD